MSHPICLSCGKEMPKPSNRTARYWVTRKFCSQQCKTSKNGRIRLFWMNAKIGAENECWPWLGYLDRDGYGEYDFDGRRWKAHRLSYFLTCEEITDGLLIRHSCDNPPCINPKHLLQGTEQDNSNDMIERNRQVKREGMKNTRAKLTDDHIRFIRNSSLPVKDLMILFNITHGAISMIKSRKRWSHID